MHCNGTNNNPNVTIDGAILTLAHSFFVDNYDCGGLPQGTLTVHGAIAQYYRGIVGQVGTSGYLKNYNYDDRLRSSCRPTCSTCRTRSGQCSARRSVTPPLPRHATPQAAGTYRRRGSAAVSRSASRP